MSLYQSTHSIPAVPQTDSHETFFNGAGNEDSATHPSFATKLNFSNDELCFIEGLLHAQIGYSHTLSSPSQSFPPVNSYHQSDNTLNYPSQGSQGMPVAPSYDAWLAFVAPQSGPSSHTRGQPGDFQPPQGMPTGDSPTWPPPSQPFPPIDPSDQFDDFMPNNPERMPGPLPNGANASSAIPVFQSCASGSSSEIRGQPKDFLAQNGPPEFDLTSSDALQLSPLSTDSAPTQHQHMASGSTPRNSMSPLASSSDDNQTREQDRLADRNEQRREAARRSAKKFRDKESNEVEGVRVHLELEQASKVEVLEIACERIQAEIDEKKRLTEENEDLQKELACYLLTLIEQGIAPIDPTAQHISLHAQENRGGEAGADRT
ncbi:hypothetical protein FA95DRAFT_428897 [Auriscalpium vulgare]|uniref:Uncharacterized protein n=1 Tax=Auriscalpium vulgare TaxID=40419 RepID=A0ACB8RH61_9AGAM|nr:hypothetical protein FA95DRAFT_428897 [Auriscalpium vulgare]